MKKKEEEYLKNKSKARQSRPITQTTTTTTNQIVSLNLHFSRSKVNNYFSFHDNWLWANIPKCVRYEFNPEQKSVSESSQDQSLNVVGILHLRIE